MGKPTRVSNQIRRLRFETGEMTQAELAQRIGVTRQTIIAIEQGRYSPSLEMAFQIAHAFDVTLDDVFRYEHQKEPRHDHSDHDRSRSPGATPAALGHPHRVDDPSRDLRA